MKLPFPHFLDELVMYSKKITLESKVKRIYFKCVENYKFDLANKIYQKYNSFFIIKDDSIIAIGYALMALKNKI